MQRGQQAPTHYATLGIDPGASQEDVRRAFRAAALRTHPDKAGGAATTAAVASGGDGGNGNDRLAAAGGMGRLQQPLQRPSQRCQEQQQQQQQDEYLRVQAAWAVLSSPASRAEYDRQLALQAAASQVALADTLPLSALQLQMIDGEECLTWPCRCGGCYAVAAEEAAAATAEEAAAAADGSSAAQRAHGGELLLPCTTCSLHMLVTF